MKTGNVTTSLGYCSTVGLADIGDLSDFARRINKTSVGISLPYIPHTTDNYPPYNIISVDDDHWQIELAVAGFSLDELNVTVDKNSLIIKGDQPTATDPKKYTHKGIATRNFTRVFSLGNHVKVDKVKLKNGILSIHIYRDIPEEEKPINIEISE